MRWIKKKGRTPFQQAVSPIRRKWQRAARKWEHWKFYFFLFVTLPLFIVSLIVKITETLVRIKLRESAAAAPMEAAAVPTTSRSALNEGAARTKAKPVPVPIELEKIELEKVASDQRVPTPVT